MNTIIKTKDNELKEFLVESNAIEREYSDEAFDDSWKAWKFLVNYNELTLTRLLEVHRILLLNLNNRIAGKLRNCSVRVGYKICPDYEQIEKLLDNWFSIHSNAKTEEDIKLAHVAFEGIHPFEDGNGRTGRIIMNWQRLLNKLPLLIIHEGEEQMEYYKWFKD